MYLSCLMINVGRDPDRPRPGRLWLRNRYHIHQRLCMGFPSAFRKNEDPQFLAPYSPDDFPETRVLAGRSLERKEIDGALLRDVHAPRNGAQGFLYRVDPRPGAPPVIVVQSAAKPDWDYAFHNAGFLLAAPPQVQPFDLGLRGGDRYHFRLVANPTRRFRKDSKERDGRPVLERWIGRRVPIPPDRLTEWLAHKGMSSGFNLDEAPASIQTGFVSWHKPGQEAQKLHAVRFDGILKVSDPGLFKETLVRGIGSGKVFGFGLLSVAPCPKEGD